jgi:hypothetical protein
MHVPHALAIDMSNLRRLIRRINHFLHFFAGTVSTYDTSEFFDVVAAQCEHWLPVSLLNFGAPKSSVAWAMW